MIPELRHAFNQNFTSAQYAELLVQLGSRCGSPISFRVAETPVFIRRPMLDEMARQGALMAEHLLADPTYLARARAQIPAGYDVGAQTSRPHFLTADFAWIRSQSGALEPKLVEIQAFPSVFGYQAELCSAYRSVFGLGSNLGVFLGELDDSSYCQILRQTIVRNHPPENVVLTEFDPLHQKTFPDFAVTSRRLGIPIVDIATVEPVGNKLHYRDARGRLIPIHRIYNRAIADELIAKNVRLRFDLRREWDVEWAGHPNWYFLISKYSVPALWRSGRFPIVPPAVFLDEFLEGSGKAQLANAGVPMPVAEGESTCYTDLLLKPLFSFAGKGIEFEPTQHRLQSIPVAERCNYMLQQRMRFEPTVETPFGLTQAEVRILYLWPDDGALTPAISLVRLGRGKMMGVDHNKNQEWVGGSAAFCI